MLLTTYPAFRPASLDHAVAKDVNVFMENRMKQVMRCLAGVLVLAAGSAVAAEGDVWVMRHGLPNACRIWGSKTQNGTIFYVGCTTATPRGNTRHQPAR